MFHQHASNIRSNRLHLDAGNNIQHTNASVVLVLAHIPVHILVHIPVHIHTHILVAVLVHAGLNLLFEVVPHMTAGKFRELLVFREVLALAVGEFPALGASVARIFPDLAVVECLALGAMVARICLALAIEGFPILAFLEFSA